MTTVVACFALDKMPTILLMLRCIGFGWCAGEIMRVGISTSQTDGFLADLLVQLCKLWYHGGRIAQDLPTACLRDEFWNEFRLFSPLLIAILLLQCMSAPHRQPKSPLLHGDSQGD